MMRNTALARTYPVFTENDYLEFERFASEKHEFLHSGVYAMAGFKPETQHNLF